jgi:hypothetical protein
VTKAYEYTREMSSIAVMCFTYRGILHINENAGGTMTEGPRLNRPGSDPPRPCLPASPAPEYLIARGDTVISAENDSKDSKNVLRKPQRHGVQSMTADDSVGW